MIELRPMTNEDVETVAILEKEIYATPWSEQVFVDELRQPGRSYVVAVDAGMVVGYGGMMVVIDEAHITTMAVAESHRGRKLGTRLMLHLARRAVHASARHLTLEVRPSNHQAQALYRLFGMGPVGVRKDYYIDEDALIMWANDIDSPEYGERLDSIAGELDD